MSQDENLERNSQRRSVKKTSVNWRGEPSESEIFYDSDGELEKIVSDGFVAWNTELTKIRMDTSLERIEARYRECNRRMKLYFEEYDRAKREARRNTKDKSRKARSWCFTLNNYTSEEVEDLLKKFKNTKYVFQEEIGESGVRHLQGIVTFPNQIRLKPTLKELNCRAHWEIAESTVKSRMYCQKPKTRNGKIYKNI